MSWKSDIKGFAEFLCYFALSAVVIAQVYFDAVIVPEVYKERDYLREWADNATAHAMKRERMIEAQAKLLRTRPYKIKTVYKELP